MRPIALTCGDPSGIGPEIAVKAWRQLRDEIEFFVIGDPDHFREVGAANTVEINEITSPDETADATATGLPVLAHPFARRPVPGQPAPHNAPAIIAVIERAVELVQAGAADAICTNPINKAVLHDGANFAFPGHTEFLAALAKTDSVAMMLTAPGLRVVPVTIHIALNDVAATLTAELIVKTIRLAHSALITDFGIATPHLAVAGLNPHAGEGGAMGNQERDLIGPVLDRLRADGLSLDGPLSADTMFHAPARAAYDAAVCMYHDQALIPIKTIDFANGVNVTLGLPFVRTSPDHGTAFDIAGSNVADPSSLIAALRQARALASARGSNV